MHDWFNYYLSYRERGRAIILSKHIWLYDSFNFRNNKNEEKEQWKDMYLSPPQKNVHICAELLHLRNSKGFTELLCDEKF